MTREVFTTSFEAEQSKASDNPGCNLEMSRRSFVQMLGAGLLITVMDDITLGQRRRRGSPGARNVAARLHINEDGTITVLTGKVEEGQGSRAELTQAAAHPDSLGVTLFAYGALLLGDRSVPNYYGPHTTEMRRSKAHSTLIVDGKLHTVTVGKRTGVVSTVVDRKMRKSG